MDDAVRVEIADCGGIILIAHRGELVVLENPFAAKPDDFEAAKANGEIEKQDLYMGGKKIGQVWTKARPA